MIGVSRNRKSPPRRRRWTPMSGPIPPRPARGSFGRRAKDRAAKSCRLRPQAGICDPCIDAPGFGKLGNSLSEGFNDKAKTLKKAVAAYPTSSASGSGHSSSSAKATIELVQASIAAIRTEAEVRIVFFIVVNLQSKNNDNFVVVFWGFRCLER